MNLEQLTSNVSKKTDLTKEQVKTVYNALVETLLSEMKSELPEDTKAIKISIPKIGKLKVKYREEYQGYNPSKKEKITIPASKRIYFSSGKYLKKKVNEK